MLELRCSRNYDFLGIVGEKTGLQDMNGDNLYVGDIVCKDNDKFKGKEFVVCEDNFGYFIFGFGYMDTSFSAYNLKRNKIDFYKQKSYKSMKKGDEVQYVEDTIKKDETPYVEDTIKYCDATKHELTISEIEKKLGYNIKIVGEK